MMNFVFAGMMLLGVVSALVCGRMEEVSTALLGGCGQAVELLLGLTGSMCLWCGLMQVADRAGLTQKLSRLLAPLMGLLFPGLEPTGPAARAITLNLSANLLGLGNAATPLGLRAMGELARLSPGPVASNHMAMFVVLNTAALDLLPTTTALLRMQAGSAAPFDILPAVWLASAASVVVGAGLARLLAAFPRGNCHAKP